MPHQIFSPTDLEGNAASFRKERISKNRTSETPERLDETLPWWSEIVILRVRSLGPKALRGFRGAVTLLVWSDD
jgi:hypothetical protein